MKYSNLSHIDISQMLGLPDKEKLRAFLTSDDYRSFGKHIGISYFYLKKLPLITSDSDNDFIVSFDTTHKYRTLELANGHLHNLKMFETGLLSLITDKSKLEELYFSKIIMIEGSQNPGEIRIVRDEKKLFRAGMSGKA